MIDIPDKAEDNYRPLSLVYGLLLIASVGLGLAVKFYFRGYIVLRQINDFGITGSLPSLLYVSGFIFFYFSVAHLINVKVSYKTVIAITLGALTYEILPLSSVRTFDIKDIAATILGALMALYIYYVLEIRARHFIVVLLFAVLFSSCSDKSVDNEQYSGGGFKIVFASAANNQSELFTIYGDGTHFKKLCDFKNSYSPRWTPDGRNIVFMRNSNGVSEIVIMDSTGNNERKVTEGEAFAISPSGDKIAYILMKDYKWEVYCINVDGNNNLKLTNSERQKYSLYWSPVSSEITFVENDNHYGKYENIYKLNIESGRLDTLAKDDYELPVISDWSKDGNYILFGANHADVYQIDLRKNKINQLTNSFMRDESAKYSPDGRRIIFESGRENKTQIYMMNRDGSNQQKISNSIQGAIYPKWAPDGSEISYVKPSLTNAPKIVIASPEGKLERYLRDDGNSAEIYSDWLPIKVK